MLLRSKKTQKMVWIILAVVIIPLFIIWGSESLLRRQKKTPLMRIAGERVSPEEFQEAEEAVKTQAILQFGENLGQINKYLDFTDQAWERLVLLNEAKKRKIKITDKEVVEFINRHSFFQKNGNFNAAIYYRMVKYVFRTQPRILEERIRQNLTLTKLFDVVSAGINLDDKEIKENYEKENEKISVYYIAARPQEFAVEINPDEQTLKDYFAKNSLDFKQPLSFNIEFVSSESEGKLKEFAQKLREKKDFIKSANELGLSIKETGWFSQTDPIPQLGWSPQVSSLISRLNTGETSPSIYLDKQYYILRLKGRREPYVPDYDAVKDKVKEAFIKDKSTELAREKINACLKQLKDEFQVNPEKIDFAKSAKIYGLKANATDLFGYDSYIEGIGASKIFFVEIKKLKEEEFSESLEMPSGFYIIKLKERIPVDENKFKEEKEEFSRKLLQQKKEESFNRFLEELKRKAQLRD